MATATTNLKKSQPLIESIRQTIKPEQIDAENGIVRGVKILGRESKNGRIYSDQALADAAKLYEDVDVNIDHDRKEPHRERGLLEGFGVIRKPIIQADGVYGDLHFLKTHSAAPLFLECASRFPTHIGLSHNADGKTSRKGRSEIVESLDRVNSVDVVRKPATNKGLFESENSPVKTTIRQLIESSKIEAAKTCGLLEMDGMADMPADPATGEEDGVWTAFRQAILTVVDDDSHDTKAALKKIGAIMKTYDKMNAAPAEKKETKSSEGGESSTESGSAMESEVVKKLTGDVATLVESVKTLTTKLEEIEKAPPAKTKPLIESKLKQQVALTAYPKDSKEFASTLRG